MDLGFTNNCTSHPTLMVRKEIKIIRGAFIPRPLGMLVGVENYSLTSFLKPVEKISTSFRTDFK